jgi:hypothetical protein
VVPSKQRSEHLQKICLNSDGSHFFLNPGLTAPPCLNSKYHARQEGVKTHPKTNVLKITLIEKNFVVEAFLSQIKKKHH